MQAQDRDFHLVWLCSSVYFSLSSKSVFGIEREGSLKLPEYDKIEGKYDKIEGGGATDTGQPFAGFSATEAGSTRWSLTFVLDRLVCVLVPQTPPG